MKPTTYPSYILMNALDVRMRRKKGINNQSASKNTHIKT